MVARRYGQRPSQIVRGTWWDLQFDLGVALVAGEAEQRWREEQEGAAPRTRAGRPRQRPAARVNAPTGREGYADPAALSAYGMVIPSMAIPEDGIW